MNPLPFKTLVYRYFFFGWLFKDVRGAEGLERGVALHHNRRQATTWLPTYMLRWLGWSLFFYGLAGLVEVAFDWTLFARLVYAASALCLAFSVMTATAWVGLTQRQEQ